MPTPSPRPGAVRRHRRTARAVWIGTGFLCAAVIGGAGIGVALHDRSTGLASATAQAALDGRAERASRGDGRTPSPSPEVASAAPAASAPAGQVVPRATAAVAPKTTAPKPPVPPVPPVPAGCTSYSGNRRIACSLLPSFGFALSQMPALDELWEHESGWNHRAENPYSGAYGIPQALPGDKMATAGSDWATNPATQIKWGLGYIKDRYGTPAQAWAFWQANNWY